MEHLILKIGGMSCSACSATLEKALKSSHGIHKVEVNLVLNQASMDYDEKITDLVKIESLIQKTGYESLGVQDYQEKDNQNKFQLFVLAVFAVFVLFLAMGPMIGLPCLPFLNMEKNPIPYALVCFLLTTFILWMGRDIIQSGYQKLIHKSPNMDTLVSIGVLSAYLYSVYNTVLIAYGNSHMVHLLYFESAAMVILFIKIGKYFDHLSKNKTKEAIQKLLQLAPKVAILWTPKGEKEVFTSSIAIGDKIIVKPGGTIAVDGIVSKGMSTVSVAHLTGESIPLTKQKGDLVLAGSMNYDGVLIYKATKVGQDTLLSGMVKLVTEASSSKAKLARLADKISGYFVPVILILAFLSFLVWLLIGSSFARAINIFISVLVVACPCSLGLATPLSIMIATGLAANKGILIKKATALEKASQLKTIVFDKTGTLTSGQLTIERVHKFTNLDEVELLTMVGSLEKYSEHPLGKAAVKYTQDKNISFFESKNFKVLSGLGIEGVVNKKNVLIGNRALMIKENIEFKDNSLSNEIIEENENSLLFVAIDQQLVAILEAKDTVRSSSKQAITELKQLGLNVVMVTGDHEKAAKDLAIKLGIDLVLSDVLPENKEGIIRQFQEKGLVMMVGDGVNDSPSLARSDIGLAMGRGTDIAIDSADVVLLNEDLTRISDFIFLSKKTIRNIKQNLFWAFFYNTLMLPIAMGCFTPFHLVLNPMIAGLAMTMSSITVVLNALRLKKIKFKK